MDYKEKIKKLLALGASDNEHEAEAAMLKARQLMAEHKLSERDCVGKAPGDPGKILHRRSGVTCTKLTNQWVTHMARVVAGNTCCVSYSARGRGKKTYEIVFAGFEEDLEICESVFAYACECVESWGKDYRRAHREETGKAVRQARDAYGEGFAMGVEQAYAEQTDEAGWGLVLVTPKAVTDDVNKVVKKTETFCHSAASSCEREALAKGLADGKAFDPKRRLA